MVLDLVLRGATVVTPGHAEAADIGIAGGRIAPLGGTMSGTRELAAGGLLAIPGGVTTIGNMTFPVPERAGAETIGQWPTKRPCIIRQLTTRSPGCTLLGRRTATRRFPS